MPRIVLKTGMIQDQWLVGGVLSLEQARAPAPAGQLRVPVRTPALLQTMTADYLKFV